MLFLYFLCLLHAVSADNGMFLDFLQDNYLTVTDISCNFNICNVTQLGKLVIFELYLIVKPMISFLIFAHIIVS